MSVTFVLDRQRDAIRDVYDMMTIKNVIASKVLVA